LLNKAIVLVKHSDWYYIAVVKAPCFVILLLWLYPAAAQKQGQALIDSLSFAQKTAPSDTNGVKALNRLASLYLNVDPGKALECAAKAEALAGSLKWERGVATAERMCGNVYNAKGDYSQALECYDKALKRSEEINDLPGVASNVGNIGGIYHNQGNYPKAMENFLRALTIFEALRDVYHQAVNLGNIGRVYEAQANYPEALAKFFASLKLYRQLNNDEGVAETLTAISNVYAAQTKYAEALQYGFDALQQNTSLDNSLGMANAYRSIGQIYYLQGLNPQATGYWYKALALYNELDSKREIAGTLANLAGSYLNMHRTPNDSLPDSLHNKPRLIDRALVLLMKASDANAEVGDMYTDAIIYENLYNAYRLSGDYAQALRYHERYVGVRDSIFSEENNARIEALGKQREEDLKQKTIEVQQAQLSAATRERYFYLGGLVAFLVFSLLVAYLYRNARRERGRSDKLLLNILPHHTANELKELGHSVARDHANVSILFTDFVDFSQTTRRLPAKELVGLIDHYYKAFDRIVKKHGLEKIKTIGDAYMAACGVPVEHADHAFLTVKAALEISDFVQSEALMRGARGLPYFLVRIGINSGSVVAGIVGDSKFAYDIWGEAVNLASRMESSGLPGKVNISGATYELVKDQFGCHHRGKVTVKHGAEVDMYFVESLIGEAVPA